jgi:hypothetical protein
VPTLLGTTTRENAGVELRRIPKQEGICQVKASHNLARVSVTFDEDNLLPHGSLAVAGLLASRSGWAWPSWSTATSR